MPAAVLDLERVTPNIYTTTEAAGLQPELRHHLGRGVVVIDTPQLPTRAVAMRAEAETHGPIRYLINTEHHVDHIFGNYWFKGVPVVDHQGLYDNFMDPNARSRPVRLRPRGGPDRRPGGGPIIPDRDTYYADPNKGTIVFTGDLTLRVGDHTFNLLHTPGHTPGQLAVHVPEERAVFTGDTIFSECQTWLMTSNVDQWLEALERIRQLDVDHLIPGHGPVTTLKYVDTQRANLLDWKSAVADAVAKGWTREETVARVRFDERYPVDVGQGYMMDHIQTKNAGSLWDKFTALGYAKGR